MTLACGPGHHGKEKAWDKAREAASIEGASENDQQQFYDRSEQREDASLRERPLAADCPLATFLSGFEINSLECRRESHLLNSATMFDLFCLWFGAVLRIFHNRQNLLLENLALRQQLVVLKRRHPKPKLGAGRVPGTSVLAVVARRAISAQPPLPTNLIIFGLTGQPGWKKAMVPPFCESSRMGSSPSREATRTVFIGSPN